MFFIGSLQFLPTLVISWFKDNQSSRYCTLHMFLLVWSLLYLVASVVNNLFIITSISFESIKFCFIGSFTFLEYCTMHMFLLVCSLLYLVASVVNNLFIITSISFESIKFCFIGSFTFLEFSSCIIFYIRSSLHCCECFNWIAAFVITVTCSLIRTLFKEILVIKLSSFYNTRLASDCCVKDDCAEQVAHLAIEFLWITHYIIYWYVVCLHMIKLYSE